MPCIFYLILPPLLLANVTEKRQTSIYSFTTDTIVVIIAAVNIEMFYICSLAGEMATLW
jgi:hypothetical protein